MRDVVWRAGFTITLLMAVACLGPSLGCGSTNRLVEFVTGRTPQARVEGYLNAIARGNRNEALRLWTPEGTPNEALAARRDAVTDDLLALDPGLEYQVLDVEWWRTCCEPGVVDDPARAGGARLRVAIRGERRPEATYVFDVLVPGGYWAEAAGSPVREWAIVDVYPEGQSPLVWTWRSEP